MMKPKLWLLWSDGHFKSQWFLVEAGTIPLNYFRPSILSLEKKLISTFDGLDKEIPNSKDVIIKNLLAKNQRLRKKVSDLESKVISLERDHNSLE